MAISSTDLKKLVSNICRVPPEQISAETRFIADLKMDSLASLDLLTDLEEEHGIEVTQADARNIQTFGQLLAFLEAKGALED
jgi:acyl carrier protein